MCFNAFKHYKFGWYDTQTIEVDESVGWTGELVAFVDAKEVPENSSTQAVIARFGDFYMQLNSAKDFNVGTKEKQNQVVIIEGTKASVESSVVGGLAYEGNIFGLGGNMVVELCELNLGGSVDTAKVSIYNKNQESGCNAAAGRNSNIGITGFKLIDTDTNEELEWNSESSKNMSILAVTWGNVNCVKLTLTGKRNHEQDENVAPFALYGDNGWNSLFPGDLTSGSYTIEATAWPQKFQKGLQSETNSFSFTIP